MTGVGLFLCVCVLVLLIIGFFARIAWDVIILERQARRRLEDEFRYLDRRVSALEQLCHRKSRDHEEAH